MQVQVDAHNGEPVGEDDAGDQGKVDGCLSFRRRTERPCYFARKGGYLAPLPAGTVQAGNEGGIGGGTAGRVVEAAADYG